MVVSRHGWRAPNLIFAVFATASLVIMIFFQPETLYQRQYVSHKLSSTPSLSQKPEQKREETYTESRVGVAEEKQS